MNIEIDSKKLKLRPSENHPAWKVWEKKNLNIHRGVVQWSVDRKFKTIAEVASHVRAGIKDEFNPGWFRGFGFGTILQLHEVPGDFKDICNHIDKRANTKGVWQWSIMIFQLDKFAMGVHTWQHGFLRPIVRS